ncbi:hypothetical protein Tco_0622871 [Tanacetum coccineum]
MAYSNSGLDTEVTSCSKECEESYAKLKKLYDEQREQLGDASIEIQAYTQALKKVEAQLMSAKDKSGLGYGDQIHEGVSSYENEVLESVFDSSSSDVEDNESKFTYGPNQSKTSEYDAKTSDFASCESNSSVETLEYVPKLAGNVKEQMQCRDFYHLIRDCDFHEKRMAKQVELNKQKGKGTGQGENRPVWNNVQRLNHQNKFVPKADDPQKALKNKGIVDSRCSRHMTRNKAYLVEYQDYNGGLVAFGGSKGQITGKGKIITGKLDFEDVYFVKELKQFNLFSVSQMCDKKNKVLFTDSECLVLSPDFKLPDENQVLLRVPRQNIQ